MRALRQCAVALVLIGVCPGAVSAQWAVAPFAGIAAGTRIGFPDLDGAAGLKKPLAGVSVIWREPAAWGADVDLVWVPSFLAGNIQPALVTHSRVVVVTLNGRWAPARLSIGRLRPYLTGGAGAARVDIADVLDVVPVSRTRPAFAGGGGAILELGARWGARFDVRYVQTVGDSTEETGASDYVKFWRVTGGFIWRFAGRRP